MKKLIPILLFLMPVIALAEEGGHGAATHGGAHGGGGIPESVTYQAINFVLYAVLLFFLLRKPVKNFFKSREEAFKQALIKAESARAEAEKRRQEIKERLSTLESTTDQSIAQARAEAEALKAKIIQDAAELSRQLQEDARRTANHEIERAKGELRDELLSQSVALSQKMLVDKMADQDQKRLQTEFVDKIQVVR